MKKIRLLIKNIKWLMKNDVSKINITTVVSGKDIIKMINQPKPREEKPTTSILSK